jgi:lysophospholipase L1-like esterase
LLSVWAFAPGSARGSRTGAWPTLLAARDPDLKLLRNAGVPGNTTTQMLARLRRDVLAYHPDMLFVLGGTNDVCTNIAASTTLANLRKIVKSARAQGIEVVLLTIPPSNDLRLTRLQRLRAINAALIGLGRAEGITVVDVYAALASTRGRLSTAYVAADGLHLSRRGEEVVAATVYAQLTALPPSSPYR